MHHDPTTVLKEIHGYMPLKNPDNKDLDIYLGTKLKETHHPNGVWAWEMSLPSMSSKQFGTVNLNCSKTLMAIINFRPRLKPLGKPVDIRMWVDSDHTGEKQTRRSCTGFFIYINMACIDWVSK